MTVSLRRKAPGQLDAVPLQPIPCSRACDHHDTAAEQLDRIRLPSILIDDLFTPTQTHALKPRNRRRHPVAARATAARRIVCRAGQVQRRENSSLEFDMSLEQLSTWVGHRPTAPTPTLRNHARLPSSLQNTPCGRSRAASTRLGGVALWTCSSAASGSPKAILPLSCWSVSTDNGYYYPSEQLSRTEPLAGGPSGPTVEPPKPPLVDLSVNP